MADGINTLGNLLCKTNANGALLVALDGGVASGTVITATTAFILGAASTSGIRLDLESGTLAVREGDDSGYGPLLALTLESTGSVTSGSNLGLAASGLIFWSGRTRLAGPADAQLNIQNAAASAGAGFDVSTDAVLKVRVRAQNAYATVDALAFQTGGNALNYTRTAYAAGTAYVFTNTAAAIDVGTTDPAIVLDKAGTYLIFGQVHMAYNAATVAAETATIKVRRTNNTAADLSAVVVIDLPASTLLTNSYGIEQIPPFVYTTTATDDAVTIFANVSAALSAGSIDATAIGTSLIAIRIA